MELDFDKRCQIEGDIRTIKHLLSLNPFYTISDIEIQRSILTRILICLRDLMYKSEHNAHSRVDFTEDVGINLEDKINDVTDLIKFMRDALCHEESSNRKLKEIRNFTLNLAIIKGKQNAFNFSGKIFGSDYEDDICFMMGSQKLYLNRHIVRAFNESVGYLQPLLNTKR